MSTTFRNSCGTMAGLSQLYQRSLHLEVCFPVKRHCLRRSVNNASPIFSWKLTYLNICCSAEALCVQQCEVCRYRIISSEEQHISNLDIMPFDGLPSGLVLVARMPFTVQDQCISIVLFLVQTPPPNVIVSLLCH